jgi:hypothetical protein
MRVRENGFHGSGSPSPAPKIESSQIDLSCKKNEEYQARRIIGKDSLEKYHVQELLKEYIGIFC